MGKIEDLIEGSDRRVHGVYVKVTSKKDHTKVLWRPIQHIYPIEVESDSFDLSLEPWHDLRDEVTSAASEDIQRRPVRRVATQA